MRRLSFLRPLLAAGCSLAAVTPVLAQRDLKDIPDPSPDSEKAALKLGANLEINLWASDPMIAKPIQMAWDAKGRLWVASSAIYPHIKPGAEPDDKIVVLEDTNGDGTADKRIVFTEGLLIPTGIWPTIDAALPPGHPGRYNAAYVANSTEVLLMRDTNGDGQADDKQVIMSGFGTEDTHHIIHSFKGGPDGYLYFNQSVYIHSHVETPFGTRRLLGSGIWQYRPENGQLEVFTMGQVNPWGHIWDRWGQSFTTDGAYGEGINFAYPGATFICLPNQRPRILKGLNPGQPKHCGLEIISGRHFPEDWQGTLITNDFRGHRVNRFAVSDDGSGFASRQMEDVVATTHQAFRPIDLRMGPDGALYVADWYNPIIQHGEVDFRDDRRDHVHGRVWRVTVKGRALSPRPDIEKASVDQLIAMLKEPENWVRLWAKWELRSREGREAISAKLHQAAQSVTGTSPQDEHFKLELLWAGQTLEVNCQACTDLAKSLLKSPQAEPRAAAVRYFNCQAQRLKNSSQPDPAALQDPGTILDSHPRVRLETVNALRTIGTPQAVEKALTALDKPVDANLDFALWLTAWELADVWLPALEKGEITFGGSIPQLSFALKAANRPAAAGALVKLVRESRLKPDSQLEVLKLIADLGKPEDLSLLAELVLDGAKLPTDQRVAVIESLIQAAKQRQLKPAGELNRVEALFSSPDAKLKAAALRLSGAWKQESARAFLTTTAKASDSSPSLRAAASAALADLGGQASRQVFEEMIRGGATAAVKAQGASALAQLNPAAAAPLVAETLAALGEEAALATPLFEAYLKSKEGPQQLAAALAGKRLSAAVATTGLQKSGQAGVDTKALQEAIQAAGAMQSMIQQLSQEQLQGLMTEVKTKGDPARGEQIYRRPELTCTVCHSIGAAGGVIGPDLVSVGASAPVDYIIESLLEPSKKIKEGYATTLVTTKQNDSLTGFLIRQDDKELVLRDAVGKLSTLPRGSVAKVESVPVSLMAPGLTANLRRDEFVDLVRFLSELGKEGPFKAQTGSLLRRWRVLQYSDALKEPMNKDGFRALTQVRPDFNWTPAYSLVSGDLPAAAVPQLSVFVHKFCAAQSEIEVTTSGAVGLKFDDASHLHIWVDEKELPVKENQVIADLTSGKHNVTITWDHTQRGAGKLRVQLFQPESSQAKVQPVGGP